jgi:tetratricopeptide (TPR) repeat protein
MPGDSAREGARRRALLIALFFPATLFAVGRYVSFTRVTSPPYGLTAGQHIAMIYAIGDNQNVALFVDDFVDDVDRAGTLQIENAVENNQHSFETDYRRLRRRHPADRYVGVSAFTCSSSEHRAEGSEHDAIGERIRRVHSWVDAVCEARLEFRDDRGQHLMTINVHGQGTSPRSTSLTAEDRAVAFEQATRYAAFNAADMITPRTVRETIELDPSAPSFDEGMSMVESDRLADARAIWEIALRRHRDSAALNYNLGAVCQAAGDLKVARKYFEAAVRLAPNETRYRQQLRKAGEH